MKLPALNCTAGEGLHMQSSVGRQQARLERLDGGPGRLGDPVAQGVQDGGRTETPNQEVKLGRLQLARLLEHRHAQLRRQDQLVPLKQPLRHASRCPLQDPVIGIPASLR